MEKKGREDWGRSKGMRVMKEKIYTYGKEGREDWGRSKGMKVMKEKICIWKRRKRRLGGGVRE